MKRRAFLQVTAAASAHALINPLRAAANSGGRKVAILGGGVAGMSAAHELVERGFQVSVYEKKSIPGGKARSINVPGSGQDGRHDLPGEHGFRFFPGFYKHLPDTMKRIPVAGNRNGVFDNLVEATHTRLSRIGQKDLVTQVGVPKNLPDLKAFAQVMKEVLFDHAFGTTHEENTFFLSKVVQFLSACEARRFAEFENESWWTFVQGDRFSDAYRSFYAKGLTRNLVACRAEDVSARTGATIFVQILRNIMGIGEAMDRVLNAPTNDAWIGPWLTYLASMGVDYHRDSPVRSLEFDGSRVTGAWVEQGGTSRKIEADYFLLCVPKEVAVELLPASMISADSGLGALHELRTEWMNGIQFFLKQDVPLVHGHVNYFDSPWSLTSISQKQFWPHLDLADYGNGEVQGVLSVDISNWDEPGIVFGKPAKNCSKEEIVQEVWKQMQVHLNDNGAHELPDGIVQSWFLDPGITFPAPGVTANDEPLLINTQGSWSARPNAATRIPNFFLAADYVRCSTDLATMEGANETARRAVNAILKASGSRMAACKLWPLQEFAIFAPARALDAVRFAAGLPQIGVSQHEMSQALMD